MFVKTYLLLVLVLWGINPACVLFMWYYGVMNGQIDTNTKL